MRRLVVVLVVALSIPLAAGGQRRAASVAPLPQNTFYVPTVLYSWEDAASLMIKKHGRVSIITTGDADTPYVAVEKIVADFVHMPDTEPYTVTTYQSHTAAAAAIAAATWVRVGSQDDGAISVVGK